MNREIIFRGKRTGDGEWVEGYYVRLNEEEHRIYSGYAETDGVDYYPDWQNVTPETVGQYTGLTDKNGTKIFEGDIVQSIASEDERDWKVWIVGFDDGCFYFESNSYVLKNRRKLKNETNLLCEDEIFLYGLIVIGNIYDNPESTEVSE